MLTSDARQAPPIVEKPDCPYCARSDSSLGDTSCHGCRARDIARSPAAWKAARSITDAEVRDAILTTYGHEGYEAARRAVWKWMKRLGVVKT